MNRGAFGGVFQMHVYRIKEQLLDLNLYHHADGSISHLFSRSYSESNRRRDRGRLGRFFNSVRRRVGYSRQDRNTSWWWRDGIMRNSIIENVSRQTNPCSWMWIRMVLNAIPTPYVTDLIRTKHSPTFLLEQMTDIVYTKGQVASWSWTDHLYTQAIRCRTILFMLHRTHFYRLRMKLKLYYYWRYYYYYFSILPTIVLHRQCGKATVKTDIIAL